MLPTSPSIAANEEAGIYAALDSTFTVLADNAGELTDPANGIKKIDSETMITATYDALAANFDNSSEELYGAIGAAAARASDNGLIKAMKDDGALSALAKQEKKEINYWSASKKAYKSVFDGTVDLITVPFPAFKAFAPLMKLIMGSVLEDGSQNNQMAELKEQLDEITAKLEDNRNRIEDHMYNVVAMSDIGNEMGSVKANAETIRSRIANIERNSLTEEERTQQIADLYKMGASA